MNKNATNALTLQDQGVLDIFAGCSANKTVSLANTLPLKYGVLVSNTNLDLTIQTTCPGSELKIFMLTPVVKNHPSTVTVNLNLLHDHCKIELHMVSLVFAGEKNRATATIYMEQGINESEARLLEETVICSDSVNVANLPILDIRANNIAAGHGAKIYRLDSDKIFYMQSKGLTAEQARNLLIASYPNMLFDGLLEDDIEKDQILTQFLDFSTIQHA